MAYDSASDTALANQAYQRALAIAQQKRDRLNRGYGLKADGTLDESEAGRLGSIYQTGLMGQRNYDAAAQIDRRRGFAGTSGLANRRRNMARREAIDNQAIALRDANQNLGDITLEENAAKQDWINEVGDPITGTGGNIGRRAAFDAAQTLAANPIVAPPVPVPLPTPGPVGYTPAYAAAVKKAIAQNPRIMQTLRNRY